MKRGTLLAFMCLVLVATAAGCRLVAPTPDPAEIERLVAAAVRATIEAMPTATPYPTYTPVPPAPTYTASTGVNTPRPTRTATAVPITPGSQPGAAFRTHIVVAGDTLSGIAKEYGTTVEAIMAVNEISDPELIVIGQALSIPVEEAGSVSTRETSTLPTSTATSLPPTATPTETPAP
jgi:LysM repeat protein